MGNIDKSKLEELIGKINQLQDGLKKTITKSEAVEDELKSYSDLLIQYEELIKEVTQELAKASDDSAAQQSTLQMEEPRQDNAEVQKVEAADKPETAREDPAGDSDEAETQTSDTRGQSEVEEKSVNQTFQDEPASLSEQLSSRQIEDLRQAIGINDRFTFINELFEGDAGAYDKAIRSLNEFKSYEEARKFISESLKSTYNWEDENKLVGQFVGLVERKFEKN